MPEYTLDCHHPDAEIDETTHEQDYLGRQGLRTRYYCPDCETYFEESGYTDS